MFKYNYQGRFDTSRHQIKLMLCLKPLWKSDVFIFQNGIFNTTYFHFNRVKIMEELCINNK